MSKTKIKKQCDHKNILITQKITSNYFFPKGFFEEQEQKIFNIANFYQNDIMDNINEDSIYCEDCDIYLT